MIQSTRNLHDLFGILLKSIFLKFQVNRRTTAGGKSKCMSTAINQNATFSTFIALKILENNI